MARVHPEEDRERLRQTFDRAAERYDRVRPDYPEACSTISSRWPG